MCNEINAYLKIRLSMCRYCLVNENSNNNICYITSALVYVNNNMDTKEGGNRSQVAKLQTFNQTLVGLYP